MCGNPRLRTEGVAKHVRCLTWAIEAMECLEIWVSRHFLGSWHVRQSLFLRTPCPIGNAGNCRIRPRDRCAATSSIPRNTPQNTDGCRCERFEVPYFLCWD